MGNLGSAPSTNQVGSGTWLEFLDYRDCKEEALKKSYLVICLLTGLLAGTLPLALSHASSLAYQRDALSYEQHLETVPLINALGFFGHRVPPLAGLSGEFDLEHARGNVFWMNLATFILINSLGWGLIAVLLAVAALRLSKMARSRKTDQPTRLHEGSPTKQPETNR